MHGDGPHRSSELREHARTTIKVTIHYVSGATQKIQYPSGFDPAIAIDKLRTIIHNAQKNNVFFQTDSSTLGVGTDVNLRNVEWIDYEILT